MLHLIHSAHSFLVRLVPPYQDNLDAFSENKEVLNLKDGVWCLTDLGLCCGSLVG